MALPGTGSSTLTNIVASPAAESRESSRDEMLTPASAKTVPTTPTTPGRSKCRVIRTVPESSALISNPSRLTRCGRPWAVEPASLSLASASPEASSSVSREAHGSDSCMRVSRTVRPRSRAMRSALTAFTL